MRVPLAWSTLTHNKQRLLTSVAGMASAVVLMFMQVGFFNGLLDGQVEVIRILDGELVIVNRLKYTVSTNLPFPRRRLQQALAADGVSAAQPIWMEMQASFWKNPATGQATVVRVLAFDPDDRVFRDPDIERARPELNQPETVVFDVKSRPEYGGARPGLRTELSDRTVRVVGTFALGTDFASDGTVIMSDTNFARYFPHRASPTGELEAVELGILRLAPGADPGAVLRSLRAVLPDDVAILTKDELVAREVAYWQASVPVGYVFGLGGLMGFVIGAMICYQVLFTDVSDHLPQFATLKAIGYANRYVVGVVVREALALSVLGFVPGLLVSWLLYRGLADATGLPMRLTVPRAGLVLGLTVLMAVASGLIAVRRAVAADPAEVFG